MHRIALVGLALALTTSACIIQDGDDDPPGSGSGSGSGSGNPDAGTDGPGDIAISPQEGSWFYDETTPVSSNCPGIINEGEAGAFTITQASATSFYVTPNDGAAPFTCNLDGADFHCPERASHVMDYGPSIDAVVTIHATADGTFTSPTRATGRQDAIVDCAGAECTAFGAGVLPCAFTVDYVIRTL